MEKNTNVNIEDNNGIVAFMIYDEIYDRSHNIHSYYRDIGFYHKRGYYNERCYIYEGYDRFTKDSNQIEIMNLLLKYNPDINRKDTKGFTALMKGNKF